MHIDTNAFAWLVAMVLLLCAGLFPVQAQTPVAPGHIYAYATGPTIFTVFWFHDQNGVLGFVVKVRTSSGVWTETAGIDHTNSNTSIPGLELKPAHTFKVCAVYPDHSSDDYCSGEYVVDMTPVQGENSQEKTLEPPQLDLKDFGPFHLGIGWQGPDHYDNFIIDIAEVPPNGPPLPPRTIGHPDDGTWGYQLVGDLQPGHVYIVQVQGCNETFFGAGKDNCYGWSQPKYMITAAWPFDIPPEIEASPESTNWVYVEWTVPQPEAIDRVTLKIDGRTTNFGPTQRAFRHAVAPNDDPHRYLVCLGRASTELCSGQVTASGQPTPPTAPVDLTLEKVLSRTRGPLLYKLALRWRNVGIPGRVFVIERLEVGMKPIKGSVGTILEQRWVEVHRLSPKGGVDSAVIGLDESSGIGVKRTLSVQAYRVCAVVPSLDSAGVACSAQANL